MRILLFFMIIGLGACKHAGPGFRGAPQIEKRYDGSTFTMSRRGNVIEMIRISPEWLPKYPDISRKAALLAEAETSCKAAWVEGDPAMMWVGLKCEGERVPKRPRRPRTVFCEIEDLYKRGESLAGYMTCQ